MSTWPKTISATTPPPLSRWLPCCACTKHRITFAGAVPKGAFAKPLPKSCSRPCRPSKRKSRFRPRSKPGRPIWWRALAPSRFASSSTKSCFDPTKTPPSTRLWSRPAKAARQHLWTCCKTLGPSLRPGIFIGNGFCLTCSPRARAFPPCKRLPSQRTCRWPRCRRFRLTIRTPPKSTTPCLFKDWERARSPWASTLLRPDWR